MTGREEQEAREHQESVERHRKRVRMATSGWPTVDLIISGSNPELAAEIVAGLGQADQEALATIVRAAKPGRWSAKERDAHAETVQRAGDIQAAHRTAKTIVTTFLGDACTIVAGCRYGETGLVTSEMIAQIRKGLALLEGEL